MHDSSAKLPLPAVNDRQLEEPMSFDDASRALRRNVYDIDYVELGDRWGGQLWVTRHGWCRRSTLDPSHWYLNQLFSRDGRRLVNGSGAVYRVPGCKAETPSPDLVVKFSRVGQDVQLDVSSKFFGDIPRHELDGASFNDPFQEFSLVEALRQDSLERSCPRIFTKRPLAIYSPGRRFTSWQLGRNEACFLRDCRRLARDQARHNGSVPRVEMAVDRQYITLFEWVRGHDVQQLVDGGQLSADEAARLVTRANEDLASKGFRMLDMKPNHLIVRLRPDGTLLQRKKQVAYVLVDFELLQPTNEVHGWCQAARGEKML